MWCLFAASVSRGYERWSAPFVSNTNDKRERTLSTQEENDLTELNVAVERKTCGVHQFVHAEKWVFRDRCTSV